MREMHITVEKVIMRMVREEKAVRERLAQHPMVHHPIGGMDEIVRQVHILVMAMAVAADLRVEPKELPNPLKVEPDRAIELTLKLRIVQQKLQKTFLIIMERRRPLRCRIM